MIKIFFVLILGMNAFAQTDGQSTAKIKAEQETLTLPSTSLVNLRAPKAVTFFRIQPSTWGNRREFFDGDRFISVDETENSVAIDGEYGISERASFGVSTTYGQGREKWSTRTYEYKRDGLSNPHIYVKYSPGESKNVFFEADLSISPGSASGSTRSTIGNRFSGGHTFTPSLGYEGRVTRDLLMGAFGYYQLKGRSRLEYKTAQGSVFEWNEYSGGNVLGIGGFAELQKGDTRFGFSSIVSMYESQKAYSDLGRTIYYDPRSFLRLRGYGNFPLTSSVHFVPALGYGSMFDTNVDDLNYKVNSTLDLQLALRMAL